MLVITTGIKRQMYEVLTVLLFMCLIVRLTMRWWIIWFQQILDCSTQYVEKSPTHNAEILLFSISLLVLAEF